MSDLEYLVFLTALGAAVVIARVGFAIIDAHDEARLWCMIASSVELALAIIAAGIAGARRSLSRRKADR